MFWCVFQLRLLYCSTLPSMFWLERQSSIKGEGSQKLHFTLCKKAGKGKMRALLASSPFLACLLRADYAGSTNTSMCSCWFCFLWAQVPREWCSWAPRSSNGFQESCASWASPEREVSSWEVVLTPWFSINLRKEVFPWFSFLRKQLNKNYLNTETRQREAFTHIFVICVHLLEDSADLDSIEAVANEVLNMEMPSTPQQLQALTEDIRERVESLSDVEVILQQSAGDIARAEMLLEEAKRARYATLFHLIVSENAV